MTILRILETEFIVKLVISNEIELILVLQKDPVHPGSQSKQIPFCSWQILSLHVTGQGMSQLLPYIQVVLRPICNEKQV